MNNKSLSLSKRLLLVCLPAVFFVLSCSKDAATCEDLPTLGTCIDVSPAGSLTYNAGNETYTFRTSGGGTIQFRYGSSIDIMHDSFPAMNIQLWGDAVVSGDTLTCASHENLNGKHIKDRLTTRRTVIFPDGAKLTIYAHPDSIYFSRLIAISIYDNGEAHRFNLSCRKLEYSGTSACAAQQLDEQEADGEASTLIFTATGLKWNNTYDETVAGTKITNNVPLGETFFATPNQVNDYFDDLRLGHTIQSEIPVSKQ